MQVHRPNGAFLTAWLVMAMWAIACASSSPAATSSSVVGASVPSATNIGVGGCLPGTLGVTDFGPVSTSSSTVTTGNCVVTFGSSNDVARLRLAQSDQLGSAMYRPTTGALDTTFSGDGVATFANSAGEDVAGSVAVQADGKVVVSGYYDDAGTMRAMVLRLTTTGALDPTFAGDGVREFATTDAHVWSSPQVVIDPSGRIVVGWLSATPVGTLRLARLLADGSDDASFGTAGLASHAISGGGNSGWVRDLAIDDSGRILLAGRVWPMVEWGWYGVVARFTPSGAMDTTLGGDGIIVTQCAAATGSDTTTDVIPLAGGGFLTRNPQVQGGWRTHVVRWTATGTPDPAFGTSGCVDLPTDGGAGLALDTSGRVLVGTSTNVVRLSALGVVDATFGTANVGATVRDLVVDVDGTVIAGSVTSAFRTTRLSNLGAAVPSHGTGGTSTITVGGDASAGDPSDMALLPDGQIVRVGRDTSDGSAYDTVVLRTEASKVANFGGGNDWLAGGANGVFGACLRDATNGAVTDGATWTSNLGVACPAANGAIWRGIPETTADPAALVARTTVANTTTATATLQFGLRTATAQPAGTYVAPVTFEVVAP